MEFVYSIDEFKAKVDMSKPLHHDAWRNSIDEHGIFYELTFRIYGISKKGHVLVYESKARINTLDIPKEYHKTNNANQNLVLWVKDIYEKFAKETAIPLGSTPGRWEP